jgi:hypothetical protein
VIPHSRDDPFRVYIDRESISLVSVIKGCDVIPFMPALFTRNQHLIDGMLMDATWKIIRVSVASIFILSMCNVGIPVMLGIGPKEDKVFYETFHTILQDDFNINLNSYCAGSDQGITLRAVCICHENQPFLCLRHFPVSLKRKIWNHEAGTLIRCRVRDGFQRVCTAFCGSLARSSLAQCSAIRKNSRQEWFGGGWEGDCHLQSSDLAVDIDDGAGPIQITKYGQCPGVLPRAQK